MPVTTNSIMKVDKEQEKKWLNPRLYFLKTFIRPRSSRCPECRAELVKDEDENYCPDCGLVTSASYDYTAGVKFKLPYGKK